MLRFINANILIGLAQEAVLGYIKAGKPVPQTLDGAEELLLTVMDTNEFNRLDRMPGLDNALQQLTMWLTTDDLTREWFSHCEIGKMFEEEKHKSHLG